MFSNSCIYGIRAIIYLAGQSPAENKTGIKKISADLKLPAPFLAKILQQLAKQKILSSSKGPHGGFSILRDPKKITLLDIVNSIDGPYTLNRCIMHNGTCDGGETEKHCALHNDYDKPRAELIKLFSKMTIHELVKKSVNLELISV
jgi:Rrf2 family transcriptional regulator, iron-sulfur cluster assembly transcription factor